MDEIDEMFGTLRGDAAGYRREIAALRAEIGGPLVSEAERAGQAIERALSRAIVSGKLGFEDLKRVALSAMAEIAAASIRSGLGAIFGGGKGASGLGGLFAALAGAPGRATGGPVSAGRAYRVGERGPEWFVPTASGRVEAAGGAVRNIAITVNVRGDGASEPQRLAQTGRQLAAAVRRAVASGDD